MINKFNNYILEKYGHTDLIDPYCEMMRTKCNYWLDKWLKRKGKFANFSIKLGVDLNEILKKVPEEDFKKYPVEEIDFKFKITMNREVRKLYPIGQYAQIGDAYAEQPKSTIILSKSGLVGSALRLKFEICLVVEKDTRSVNINDAKNLSEAIVHEFQHGYNDYATIEKSGMTASKRKDFMIAFGLNLLESKLSNSNSNLYRFFFLVYYCGNEEMNANISSANVYTKDDFEFSTFYKDMKILNEFDPISHYQKMVKELKRSKNKKADFIKNDLGTFVADVYEETCETEGVKPVKRLTDLRGKDAIQVFVFFNRMFKQKYSHMKEKIDKLLTSKEL
jgi:hypothetical protein